MIERIIEFSYRNRFFVFSFFALFIFLGIRSFQNSPLDALPDLSETQVIVWAKWEGRYPKLVFDQVTYPIATKLLAVPRVKTVRAISDFGVSFIYVIFEEGVDIYWARSRVLEYLQGINLPDGVELTLGPDATSLGWVMMYALRDKDGRYDLSELRTLQDFYIKYELLSVEGVAEVASVGGFQKVYEVRISPMKLQFYGVRPEDIIKRIGEKNNLEAEGGVFIQSGREYMIRSKGYISGVEDMKKIVIFEKDGIPVFLEDVADVVVVGPGIRRGAADLNGEGEIVGGIVVARYKENALKVIERVKAKLKEIKIPGVEVVITYDRSELIKKAVKNLWHTLIKEMIVVALVIIIFLLHLPSSLVALVVLPSAVIISFIPMFFMKITSNIMSLGGIAIAIGAMVDASIVVVEGAMKAREKGWKVLEEIKAVGRPIFFSLLVITISFLPIFALEGEEGRLFKPLAWTKTLSMFFASVLSITLVPSIIKLTEIGKVIPEEKNPISIFMQSIYTPILLKSLKRPLVVPFLSFLLFLSSFFPLKFIGSEFMPPLNEEVIMYMPTSSPSISIDESVRLMQIQDRIIKSFPEVELVFGKAGRAETSLDPAPLSMWETVILLKPNWQKIRGLKFEELIEELDKKVRIPGVANSWSFPVRVRIDMLTTGLKTQLGIKVKGNDVLEVSKIGEEVEGILSEVPGTRSVFAEREGSQASYITIQPKRELIARCGIDLEELQKTIRLIVGEYTTTLILGRERYPIKVRYSEDFRGFEDIKRILVPCEGWFLPLSYLADINTENYAGTIKFEDGFVVSYVYVDIYEKDVGGYIKRAKHALEKLTLPPGVNIEWAGLYEFMERVKRKMSFIVPLTIFIIFLLLYISKRNLVEVFIVMLAVPLSLIGIFWFLYILDYNFSVAVLAGIIALLGVDAETGVVMLLYLDESLKRAKEEGRLKNIEDLKLAIVEGASGRIRPKSMTVLTTLIGLFPIMFSTGLGADVMRRIAAPMIGGITISWIMELFLYPSIYLIWKKREIKCELARGERKESKENEK